jgi:hypothetical protein
MTKKSRVPPMLIIAVIGAVLIAATAFVGLLTGFFNKDDLRNMGIQIK